MLPHVINILEFSNSVDGRLGYFRLGTIINASLNLLCTSLGLNLKEFLLCTYLAVGLLGHRFCKCSAALALPDTFTEWVY